MGTRANVYIDGFNLYHGALQRENPDCKWLDLWALGEHLVPKGATLQRVRFFTASVDGRGLDPSQPQRQDTYWQALRTRAPGLTIHEGQFRTRAKTLPLSKSKGKKLRYAEVLVTEEKGSDVNLATALLLDAFRDDGEVAIVVSDDFDLEQPLKAAKVDLGRTIGVVSPRGNRWLSGAVKAHFWRRVRREWLLSSQFPDVIEADGQKLVKPDAWRVPSPTP